MKKDFNKYSKYRSIKVEFDGIMFSSKKEKNKYVELKLLEKQGLIRDLKLQPKFELQPKFIKDGKTIRSINYVSDFTFYDVELSKQIIIDVKASKLFLTDIYKLKRKMFNYRYPNLTLTEIF